MLLVARDIWRVTAASLSLGRFGLVNFYASSQYAYPYTIYTCRWPVTQYSHNLCSIFDCMNTYTFISLHTASGTYLWSKWWIERITPEFKWACFKVTRIVNSYLFLNFWKNISAVSGDAFTLLEVSKRKYRKTLSMKYYITLQTQMKEFTK